MNQRICGSDLTPYSTSTTPETLSIETSTKLRLSIVIFMAFSGQTSIHLPHPRHCSEITDLPFTSDIAFTKQMPSVQVPQPTHASVTST